MTERRFVERTGVNPQIFRVTDLSSWSSGVTIGDVDGSMPKFIIEREIPGAGKMTEAELHEVAMRSVAVLRDLGPQIQWLHTYVTDDKVYCVYLAPDESTIQEHARRAGVPASRISAVRRLLDATAAE
jgi:hypothetical protein